MDSPVVGSRAWPPAGDAPPEVLSAWHSGFGHFDYWRKVLLSDCKLVEKAKAAAEGRKVTVDDLDALAHTSDDYIAFLTAGLEGRIAFEKMAREKMGV